MSVTGVGNISSASLLLADAKSASNTSTGSAVNSASSVSTAATGTAADSSTQVTLSPAAQIFAQLAAQGITFTMADAQGKPMSLGSIGEMSLPSRSSGESYNSWAMQIASALATTGFNVSMTDPGGVSMAVAKMSSSADASGDPLMQMAQQMQQDVITPPTSGGNISQPDFDRVADQLGSTKTEDNQIFAALDTDKSGSLSNAELLSAMSQFGDSTANAGVQALEKLLVPFGDSTVTDGEFLGLESAMVAAEKPAT